MVELRECCAKVKLLGQRAEVESGARWLEAETGDPLTETLLGFGRPEVDHQHMMESAEETMRG